VWGKDWIQAKTQAECYDYLFEAAVKMAQLGINASVPPPPPLIIEGKRHAENSVHAGGFCAGLNYTLHQPFLFHTAATCQHNLHALATSAELSPCHKMVPGALYHADTKNALGIHSCYTCSTPVPVGMLCIVTARSRESYVIPGCQA